MRRNSKFWQKELVSRYSLYTVGTNDGKQLYLYMWSIDAEFLNKVTKALTQDKTDTLIPTRNPNILT